MKKKFNIKITKETESYFDRQQRISWWDQENIEKAKVMVVGAGAIGNETLKNLALLGVRNIFIVDFDTISPSNLSRTVLFRKEDIGRKKAEAAAKRTKELALAEDPNIDWFHGDAVWELGTGVYEQMDLILGCLDNVETRIAVNKHARIAKKPWIDAGIKELRCRVNVYEPDGPCYECSLGEDRLDVERVRYSCDNFKKRLFQEGKVPTVQVSSALVSAIQVQEAMKLLCKLPSASGKMISYNGRINHELAFDINQIPENPDCFAHLSYEKVIGCPLGTNNSLREFLVWMQNQLHGVKDCELDLSMMLTFVEEGTCPICKKTTPFYRPKHTIFDSEVYCETCQNDDSGEMRPIKLEVLEYTQFGIKVTDEKILDLSLKQIGIPYLSILPIIYPNQQYSYFKLQGDLESLMPNISKEESINHTTI